MHASGNHSLLQPGSTCWRLERATRAAVLIDAANYYRAFVEVAMKARRSVMILGWDVDSRAPLLREPDVSLTLMQLLNQLYARNPKLDIHILGWDFALIYALEREPMPLLSFGWKAHGPIHFQLDGEHPSGASHHQKIAVIDDEIAFVGGIDFALSRWDTSEHLPHDARRQGASGKTYGPHHDVQMMVEGDVARALGELARERWRAATGERLPAYEEQPSIGSLWPDSVEPDFQGVEVAIGRTAPAFKGSAEVREIQTLHERAIAEARDLIYIENQYFTSQAITAALMQRLQGTDAVDIIAVLPQESSGWLERSTMDALRAMRLRSLRESDHAGRLHLYAPTVQGVEIFVHAKVMIVDDRLLKIGSSNLSNRSMGFDTECDLVIEATEEGVIRRGIARVRQRLLGEHLGLTPDEVQFERGDVAAFVAQGSRFERGLVPLELPEAEISETLVDEAMLIDPERPAAIEQLLDDIAPDVERASILKRMVLPTSLLLLLIAISLIWRYSPLSDLLSAELLSAHANALRDARAFPLYIMLFYVVGGLASFPLSILLIATAMLFDPWSAFLYALVGTTCNAAVTYGVGHLLGRRMMRRLAGGRIDRLSRLVARGKVLAMVVIRILPLGPFSLVNMILGASHVRFRHFLVGSTLGVLPGIIGVTIFADQLKRLMVAPTLLNVLLLVAVLLLLLGGAGWLRWRLERREKG